MVRLPPSRLPPKTPSVSGGQMSEPSRTDPDPDVSAEDDSSTQGAESRSSDFPPTSSHTVESGSSERPSQGDETSAASSRKVGKLPQRSSWIKPSASSEASPNGGSGSWESLSAGKETSPQKLGNVHNPSGSDSENGIPKTTEKDQKSAGEGSQGSKLGEAQGSEPSKASLRSPRPSWIKPSDGVAEEGIVESSKQASVQRWGHPAEQDHKSSASETQSDNAEPTKQSSARRWGQPASSSRSLNRSEHEGESVTYASQASTDKPEPKKQPSLRKWGQPVSSSRSLNTSERDLESIASELPFGSKEKPSPGKLSTQPSWVKRNENKPSHIDVKSHEDTSESGELSGDLPQRESWDKAKWSTSVTKEDQSTPGNLPRMQSWVTPRSGQSRQETLGGKRPSWLKPASGDHDDHGSNDKEDVPSADNTSVSQTSDEEEEAKFEKKEEEATKEPMKQPAISLDAIRRTSASLKKRDHAIAAPEKEPQLETPEVPPWMKELSSRQLKKAYPDQHQQGESDQDKETTHVHFSENHVTDEIVAEEPTQEPEYTSKNLSRTVISETHDATGPRQISELSTTPTPAPVGVPFRAPSPSPASVHESPPPIASSPQHFREGTAPIDVLWSESTQSPAPALAPTPMPMPEYTPSPAPPPTPMPAQVHTQELPKASTLIPTQKPLEEVSKATSMAAPASTSAGTHGSSEIDDDSSIGKLADWLSNFESGRPSIVRRKIQKPYPFEIWDLTGSSADQEGENVSEARTPPGLPGDEREKAMHVLEAVQEEEDAISGPAGNEDGEEYEEEEILEEEIDNRQGPMEDESYEELLEDEFDGRGPMEDESYEEVLEDEGNERGPMVDESYEEVLEDEGDERGPMGDESYEEVLEEEDIGQGQMEDESYEEILEEDVTDQPIEQEQEVLDDTFTEEEIKDETEVEEMQGKDIGSSTLSPKELDSSAQTQAVPEPTKVGPPEIQQEMKTKQPVRTGRDHRSGGEKKPNIIHETEEKNDENKRGPGLLFCCLQREKAKPEKADEFLAPAPSQIKMTEGKEAQAKEDKREEVQAKDVKGEEPKAKEDPGGKIQVKAKEESHEMGTHVTNEDMKAKHDVGDREEVQKGPVKSSEPKIPGAKTGEESSIDGIKESQTKGQDDDKTHIKYGEEEDEEEEEEEEELQSNSSQIRVSQRESLGTNEIRTRSEKKQRHQTETKPPAATIQGPRTPSQILPAAPSVQREKNGSGTGVQDIEAGRFDSETQKSAEEAKTKGRSWQIGQLLCCLLLFFLLLVLAILAILIWVTGTIPSSNDSGTGFVGDRPTTPMDPYNPGNCDFAGQRQPHVISQCQCNGKIKTVTSDARAKYRALISEFFVPAVFQSWDLPLTSCDPANQAMVWLSTVNASNDQDLLQKFSMAYLYFATNGPGWDVQTSWLSGKNVCNWYGLSCGKDNSMKTIDLDSNGLVGTLPSQLALLSRLESLSFYENSLTGTIPEQVYSLTDLKMAVFSKNGLYGTLPIELREASTIEVLDLDTNKMDGPILSELGQMTNLRELNLGHNKFESEVPTDMFHLTDLTYLNLESNAGITGRLPSEFGLYTNLRFLSISDTNLRAQLPKEYSSLTDLEELRVANTMVGGSIPTSLETLSRLKYVDLSGSQFRQTLPTIIGSFPDLEYLALNNNSLQGTIPPQIGDLTSLKTLLLNGNEFTGEVPSELGKLTRLETLTLEDNRLTGRVPSEICNLRDSELSILTVDCQRNDGLGIVCPLSTCCTDCRKIPNKIS